MRFLKCISYKNVVRVEALLELGEHKSVPNPKVLLFLNLTQYFVLLDIASNKKEIHAASLADDVNYFASVG